MNNDIRHILDTWPYDQDDDLVVRIVDGENGPVLQMRIDMGLVQMNMDGHPASENPDGYDSWLEYYEEQQRRHEENQVDDYFVLSGDDCKVLRREGVQYYYRYLSLMKLEEYDRVIRDTDRNFRLFLFVKRYAANEIDRWSLDQYRPYVIMMNTRAKASKMLDDDPDSGAEHAVALFDKGIRSIIEFYNEYGISSEMDSSVELSILQALKKEFLRQAPRSLAEELERAVNEERFEDAARLRDEIKGEHRND